MRANEFIKKFGWDKAKEVIVDIPDKTATHWVFRKVPSYYSIDFKSWFYDGEWCDSDCHSEQDLIDSYGANFVLNLKDLKRLVESWELVKDLYGMERAKQYADSPYTAPEVSDAINQAIKDVESCQ